MNSEIVDSSNQPQLVHLQDNKLDITKLKIESDNSSEKMHKSGNYSKSCGLSLRCNPSIGPGKIHETRKPATDSSICEYSGMWDTMYQRLLVFQERHGHCRVPYRYQDDPQLGAWGKCIHC